MTKTVAPYGSWKSAITADFIVSKTITFGTIITDHDDIYWIEGRPQEGGRHVVVKRSPNGNIKDITPSGFYARTKVQEYGGGAYGAKNDIVYFSNYSDQRIYRQNGTALPEPITGIPSVSAGLRFAEFIVDSTRNRLIAVCEDHTHMSAGGACDAPGRIQSAPTIDSWTSSGVHKHNVGAMHGIAREPENSLVSISFDGTITPLAFGHDFYSFPKLSPDGSQLAWIEWDHPNLPWDGTTLKIASIQTDGSLTKEKTIAGGPAESIFQPEWGHNNQLFFVSDRSDWWNLYSYNGSTITPICPMQAEFGRAPWHLGYSTYAVIPSGDIVCTYNKGAIWKLGRIDVAKHKLIPIETEYTDIWWLKSAGDKIVFRGASPTKSQEIVCFDLKNSQFEVLKSSSSISTDKAMISVPRAIEFPTKGNVVAHAFYYPPTNKEYVGPDNERPPMLVKSHGGPTGTLSVLFNLELQYWTSRGFAVLDVNYRGSTGYGRKYRELLYGNWGVADVDDCADAALFVCDQGLADPNRLAIDGVSAGGYTTLCALIFRNTFRAGASYYGVADLLREAKETHKFESKSLDRLIAPYPEKENIYFERSPLEHVNQIQTPIIFFQGLEDKIVPPNQTLLMVNAMRKRKLPVAYLAFENEQHGFRKAETIKRALEAELYFYSKVLGFELAEFIEPIEIENLP